MLPIPLRQAAVTAAVAIAAALSASVTYAAVPAADIEVSAAGGTTILTTGTVTGSACNGDMGCETTTSKAAANLNVSTKGSTAGGNPANASGLALITVYYEIKGPVKDTVVPLVISGSASTSAEGPDAEGLAYIEYNDGDLYTCSSTITGPCGTEPSSGSLDAVVFTNNFSDTLYDLEVIVSGSSTLGTGKFSAKISGVTLAIEPTWLASNPGYKLKFSAGIHVSDGTASCGQGEGVEIKLSCGSVDP
ncbi:MAG: hypothetical protein ABSH33_06865 [Steroidobacteraceae bacterium]